MDNSDVKIAAMHPNVSHVIWHDDLTIEYWRFCFISWIYRETAEVLKKDVVDEDFGFGYTTSTWIESGAGYSDISS